MENLIKEIKIWETSDGMRFESQEEAYEYQDREMFNNKLPAFVDKHFSQFSLGDRGKIIRILQLSASELINSYNKNKCFKEGN